MLASDIRFRPGLLQRSTTNELASYCFGLTVMSFSMLLITGLDVTLVARFHFSALIPYSVSASLVVLLSGGATAALNVIMPHAAALHARQNREELGSLVITCTQATVILLILIGTPIMVYAGPILSLWIGHQYTQVGQPILMILVTANIVRIIGVPYTIVLIAAGQQRLTMVSPLTEGICNLLVSLALGSLLGAVGVAFGTLFGGCVGIAAQLFYSMPKTNPVIGCSRRDFLLAGIATPVLAATPLLVTEAFIWTHTLSLASQTALLIPAVALSSLASWHLVKRRGVSATRTNAVV